MKNLVFAMLLLITFMSFKNDDGTKVVINKTDYAQFGNKINDENAITSLELLEKYKAMQPIDTLNVKVKSTVVDVCQKKGCWMNLDLGNNQSALVKFKDYGFFMPLNSKGSEVYVNGKAFIELTSVADLKEYAKDAGKSDQAIDSISQPETKYTFLADGVLIKK